MLLVMPIPVCGQHYIPNPSSYLFVVTREPLAKGWLPVTGRVGIPMFIVGLTKQGEPHQPRSGIVIPWITVIATGFYIALAGKLVTEGARSRVALGSPTKATLQRRCTPILRMQTNREKTTT